MFSTLSSRWFTTCTYILAYLMLWWGSDCWDTVCGKHMQYISPGDTLCAVKSSIVVWIMGNCSCWRKIWCMGFWMWWNWLDAIGFCRWFYRILSVLFYILISRKCRWQFASVKSCDLDLNWMSFFSCVAVVSSSKWWKIMFYSPRLRNPSNIILVVVIYFADKVRSVVNLSLYSPHREKHSPDMSIRRPCAIRAHSLISFYTFECNRTITIYKLIVTATGIIAG